MSDRKKKRKAPISYRPSKEAEEKIQEETQKSGLSRNAYIDSQVLNGRKLRKRRSPAISEEMLGQLLTQVILLNQNLTHQDENGNSSLDIHVEEVLCAIRNGIFLLLSRKP